MSLVIDFGLHPMVAPIPIPVFTPYFQPCMYIGPLYPNSELPCPFMWVPNFTYWNSRAWMENVGIPNFQRYQKLIGNPVKSWALCDTIWTPTVQDTFPPDPLLVHSWRPMEDDSILMDVFKTRQESTELNNNE